MCCPNTRRDTKRLIRTENLHHDDAGLSGARDPGRGIILPLQQDEEGDDKNDARGLERTEDWRQESIAG
jgi:hypothetical protein